MTTKRQLEKQVSDLKYDLEIKMKAIEYREKSLTEHSNEIGRMQSVIDDVEQVNRDLQVKLNLAQNKINHLTSAAKSLTSIL